MSKTQSASSKTTPLSSTKLGGGTSRSESKGSGDTQRALSDTNRIGSLLLLSVRSRTDSGGATNSSPVAGIMAGGESFAVSSHFAQKGKIPTGWRQHVSLTVFPGRQGRGGRESSVVPFAFPKGDGEVSGSAPKGAISGGCKSVREEDAICFSVAWEKKETVASGETGLAGIGVRITATSGEGGNFRHFSAATFPKGGDGIIWDTLEGAEAGCSR